MRNPASSYVKIPHGNATLLARDGGWSRWAVTWGPPGREKHGEAYVIIPAEQVLPNVALIALPGRLVDERRTPTIGEAVTVVLPDRLENLIDKAPLEAALLNHPTALRVLMIRVVVNEVMAVRGTSGYCTDPTVANGCG